MSDRQTLKGLRAQSAKNPPPRPMTGNPYGVSQKGFKMQLNSKSASVKKPLRPNNLVEERPPSGLNEVKPRQMQQESDFFRNNMEVYDKERLFENLLQAKSTINQLVQENYQLKTQNLQQEKLIQKYERIIEDFQNNGNLKNVQMKLGVETSLFLQMKRQIKDQQLEIREKDSIISGLKKNSKVCKFQELDAERHEVYEELYRLRNMIQDLEGKMQLIQEDAAANSNHNQFQLDLKRRNEQLYSDNQELGRIIKLYQERNQEYEQQINQVKRQAVKSKADYENAMKKLQWLTKKGSGGQIVITQDEFDKDMEERTKLNYLVTEQKDKIAQLELQLKKYQNENRKQMEQRGAQMRIVNLQQELKPQQAISQSNEENIKAEQQKQKESEEKQLKDQEEIIMSIADEIRCGLMADQVCYNDFKVSLQQLSKGRLNEQGITDFILANFKITEAKASILARYMLRSDQKENNVSQQMISANRVKSQLFGLIEEYFLIENQDYVKEAIQIMNKKKRKLQEAFQSRNQQFVNVRELLQILQENEVLLNEIQKDEYLKWIYLTQKDLLKINVEFLFKHQETKGQIVIQIQDQGDQHYDGQSFIEPLSGQNSQQKSHHDEENEYKEEHFEDDVDKEKPSENDAQQDEQHVQNSSKKTHQLVSEKEEEERRLKEIQEREQQEAEHKKQEERQKQEAEAKRLEEERQMREAEKKRLEDVKQQQEKLKKQQEEEQRRKEEETRRLQEQERQRQEEERRLQEAERMRQEEERKQQELLAKQQRMEEEEKAKLIQSAYKNKKQIQEAKQVLEQKRQEKQEQERRKEQARQREEERKRLQEEQELEEGAKKIQQAYKQKQQKQQGKQLLDQKRKEREEEERIKKEKQLEEQRLKEQQEQDEVAKKIQKAYKTKQAKQEGKQLLEQKRKERQEEEAKKRFEEDQKQKLQQEQAQVQEQGQERKVNQDADASEVYSQNGFENEQNQELEEALPENFDEDLENKLFSSVGLPDQPINKNEVSDGEQKF